MWVIYIQITLYITSMLDFSFSLTWRNTLCVQCKHSNCPTVVLHWLSLLFNEAVSKNTKRRPDCFRILKMPGCQSYKPCTLGKHSSLQPIGKENNTCLIEVLPCETLKQKSQSAPQKGKGPFLFNNIALKCDCWWENYSVNFEGWSSSNPRVWLGNSEPSGSDLCVFYHCERDTFHRLLASKVTPRFNADHGSPGISF